MRCILLWIQNEQNFNNEVIFFFIVFVFVISLSLSTRQYVYSAIAFIIFTQCSKSVVP